MRCPKCGNISFDNLKQCEKCGKELAEVSADLGVFYDTAEGPDWFNLASANTNSITPPEIPVDEQPVDTPSQLLENIDISDLLEEAPPNVEIEIPADLDDLDKIDINEDFNKLLEEVTE